MAAESVCVALTLGRRFITIILIPPLVRAKGLLYPPSIVMMSCRRTFPARPDFTPFIAVVLARSSRSKPAGCGGVCVCVSPRWLFDRLTENRLLSPALLSLFGTTLSPHRLKRPGCGVCLSELDQLVTRRGASTGNRGSPGGGGQAAPRAGRGRHGGQDLHRRVPPGGDRSRRGLPLGQESG